ncbi:MAG: viologen exporter family transport system permease protein [Fimbriimonadaceae bacterium]|nr:viologen exporter family transport system permease protein [Fimbriimonadaceae bacterium]
MTATLRKWRALFSIYFQDGVAYRASGLIWIMTDVVVAITMPLVWAKANEAMGGHIGGYSSSDFVLYYLCMLLIGCFVTSHIRWELAMEIKEGQFSVALIRPMSFYQMTFFRNIAWRVIRPTLFFPFFLLLLFAYRSYLGDAHVYLGWELWVSVFLGHLLSFNFVYMMAMLALFTQEAQAIFELYYIPMLFLSGQLFPVAVLPDWARHLAYAFPFYFTTGVPTEILVGRVSGQTSHTLILGQLAWIVGAYFLGQILWRKGLKHYTAVGM